MYSRDQYEKDMADIDHIRATARRKLVQVELLRADRRKHATEFGHVEPCAYCKFATEAIIKISMDGFKFSKIATQCDALEQAFTERLRAVARLLGEREKAKGHAKNCKVLNHRCKNPACGCTCHPWNRRKLDASANAGNGKLGSVLKFRGAAK
jgi:hypothetical protein